MTPEPDHVESLSAKKDRRATEAKAAWKEYEAEQLAINKNMERLRALRLAREAQEAAAPEPQKVPRKRAKTSSETV